MSAFFIFDATKVGMLVVENLMATVHERNSRAKKKDIMATRLSLRRE